ncbi:MAG: hypothetical protein NVSMB6_24100 [Burkholderiaceae bacterium]
MEEKIPTIKLGAHSKPRNLDERLKVNVAADIQACTAAKQENAWVAL